jgi:hypothetical protein
MDLTQSKLSRTEWNSIEVPVSQSEKEILKLIDDGFNNVNIKYNSNQSLLSIIKIDKNEEIEAFLYTKYFEEKFKKIKTQYESTNRGVKLDFEIPSISQKTLKKLKKADIIRLDCVDATIQKYREKILEFVQLDLVESMMAAPSDKMKIDKSKEKTEKTKEKTNTQNIKKDTIFAAYSLIQIKKASITNKNKYVACIADNFVQYILKNAETKDFVYKSPEIIEKNMDILKYADKELFSHQKQLFSIVKNQKAAPKLILYTAPTGTGKTLSPIGLTHSFKVIFVCVARHVGLALAKSAISMEKKIAFAFGCETASDIRLHYFAATDCIRNKKSGTIMKIDNSVGDKVEMIICDVKSYLIAMRYMLAFNEEPAIITYWDEPTITMDYDTHDLHEIIHKNWVENKISKMVLSCATLPKEDEIAETIMDFRSKFEGAEIHTIQSYDCRKTISLTNKSGYCVLPHLLFSKYDDLIRSVMHCEENKSLLRYFDLGEIIRFIRYLNENELVDDEYTIESYFGTDVSNISMDSVKCYYLETLKHVKDENWIAIYENMKYTQTPKFGKHGLHKSKSMETAIPTNAPGLKLPDGGGALMRTTSLTYTPSVHSAPLAPLAPSAPSAIPTTKGILLTTEDAHTLTDGPTIFLADDVEKIAKFYIQQSKIPEKIFNGLMEKIERNNVLQKQIDVQQKILEDSLGGEIEKSKKMEREQFNGETHKVMNEIARLREQFNNVNLESVYIPNTKQHQQLWIPNEEMVQNAFVPSIDEGTVKDIMLLDLDNSMKLLLLLGIGVFANHQNIQYIEIMKRLAYNQQLYMIVASSDYIYGTNYQFCHGFIGKDLTLMTQQKIIQALGRIGRNNIQQEYSVRFREDSMLMSLFLPSEKNMEALKMSLLFCE